MAIPLTTQISDSYDYLDITATSAFLTRKALRRFQTIQNIEACRSVIEAALNNMCKTCQRFAKVNRGEAFAFSDNMQYFIMYCLGILKSPIITLPMIMNPIDTVDKVCYQRFCANMMSADEMLPMVSPQIICISNRELNDQDYPPLETLERASIRSDSIYLCYNSMTIYMYIGRYADPFFIYEIFKVEDFS